MPGHAKKKLKNNGRVVGSFPKRAEKPTSKEGSDALEMESDIASKRGEMGGGMTQVGARKSMDISQPKVARMKSGRYISSRETSAVFQLSC